MLNVLNKKISKYEEEKTEDNVVVVFLGYGMLQKKLEKEQAEDDSIVTIEDLIYESKNISNFKYILYDKEDYINKLGDGKVDTLLKRSRGLWLGKDFDSQQTFDVVNQYTEVVITNSNVVVVKNGNASYIKFN